MYLGLFLVPWILMYTFSSLVFNHFGTIRGWYGGNLNVYEKADEIEYKDAFSVDVTPKEAAKQILLDLDRDGPHLIRGHLKDNQFTVIRQNIYRNTRIIYFPKEGRIIIEEQKPQVPGMLTRMHMRHGFQQDYLPMKLWGLGVEITILAMLFWIASGVWLWWMIKPARLWGALSAIAGLGLFGILLFGL